MPKPHPHRLDPDAYRHQALVQPRINDLDQLGHVNNAALTFILQDGRTRFFRDMRMWPFTRDGGGSAADFDDPSTAFMVVSQSFDYVGEAIYPDDILIFTAIADYSRSTFTVAQLATQNGTPIAFCTCTLVHVSSGRAASLDDALRSKLDALKLKPAAAGG